MSISTPSGDEKSPGSVKVTGKPAAKPGAKPATPSGKGKSTGGPRKPIAPVKVSQDRNWGPIAMFAAVGVIFVVIVGWGVWAAWGPDGASVPWQTKISRVDGVQTFDVKCKETSCHIYGPLAYEQSPPVGGDHTPIWQQCMGNIYTEQIPKEHAMHSLEHGAVWVAYRPDLPADQVEALKKQVTGKGYTMLSPYPGLDKAVSLQAWGYQLKLDDPNDGRITDFINALAKNATKEPNATCGGGVTAVGDKPLTEEQIQAKFGGQQQ
ncbi:DUF3105 domain-containing protein [Catelliglobosispora koreensis]|uniref:DUF3105 domain-containing protein n=1 Tax=Catelliglobosispora koreensis TaxID=129052 RepID=UPI00036C47C3|nr:DUF3105 domain-containing protein [Catelliglobosispora koreensis]